MGIFQASISLATTTFGASAVAFSGGATPFLPAWAGIGLGVAGCVFAASAILATQALMPRKMSAAGFPPRGLIGAGYHNAEAARAFMAIAYELDEQIARNDGVLKEAAAQFERVLRLTRFAPFFGVVGGASVALVGIAWTLTPLAAAGMFMGLGQLVAWRLGKLRKPSDH